MSTAISLKDVCLEIPIISSDTKQIKKRLINTVTGGSLKYTKGTNGNSVEALKNINCSICDGEKVALIGHNGSGKSTFLRLISGIYAPTAGDIFINCKVYPMIQKSFITGVELSGYNAVKAHYLLFNQTSVSFESYLNEIIEFSGLGEFIYMPLKTYSEGMSSRLLFSLLTSTSHECLAIDEGFGAGDAEFYEKAQSRFEKFMYGSNTLILASHSEELIRKFCRRGLVFKKGSIVYDSEIEDALNFYNGKY